MSTRIAGRDHDNRGSARTPEAEAMRGRQREGIRLAVASGPIGMSDTPSPNAELEPRNFRSRAQRGSGLTLMLRHLITSGWLVVIPEPAFAVRSTSRWLSPWICRPMKPRACVL